LSADGYAKSIATFGAENEAALEARYPLTSYASPSEAVIGLFRDFKSCTARFLDQTWSKYTTVFAYQFNDRSAPSYFHSVTYPMGAYHTAELQYLFPLFHGGQGVAKPLNSTQQTLSDELVDYWASFAKSGEPKLSKAASHPWPRYTTNKDNVQLLDTPITTATAYGKEHDCELWDRLQAYKR
jgi:para-nitrobenzyl esterase